MTLDPKPRLKTATFFTNCKLPACLPACLLAMQCLQFKKKSEEEKSPLVYFSLRYVTRPLLCVETFVGL